MPTPFIMPKFDMDQTSATIIEWLKQEGEFVQANEEVLVVETEKVAMEVAAPASGILAGIRAEAGDEVPVTEIIAYILAEGESEADLPIAAPAAAAETTPKPLPSLDRSIEPAAVSATPVALRMARELDLDLREVRSAARRVRKSDIENHVASLKSATPAGRVAATPAARRLARQMGLEINHIDGSGPRGRVQEEDVRDYSAAAVPGTAFADRDYVILPMTSVRRTIAERMQGSFQTAPHIALSIEVDVSGFEAVRQRLSEQMMAEGSPKISLTSLLIFITSRVLERHRRVNSSLIDGQIYAWKDTNIGFAAAAEDGLRVPVVHKASELTPAEINERLLELVDRARTGKLTLSDVKGGTFTITNLGMYGIHSFRAIINPPESAILAVGAVVRKPIVIDDQDRVEVRPMMNLTLSADHRILDGVEAAKFLLDLAEEIQNPSIEDN